MICNPLHSIKTMADGMQSFEKNLVFGIKADEMYISTLLHESLMLVTCLHPVIGCDMASKVRRTRIRRD